MPLGSKCNQLGRRPRGGRDRDAGMCPSARRHRGWPAAPTACHRFALGVFRKNHLCPHHGFGHPGSGAGRKQTSIVLNHGAWGSFVMAALGQERSMCKTLSSYWHMAQCGHVHVHSSQISMEGHPRMDAMQLPGVLRDSELCWVYCLH